ncbi:MAG: IPExxxVDY family protein [Mesonia sp.]
MAKYTLSLEDDYNFDLIGLCSHQADYRVCWSINETMGLRLQKSIEPYMVSGKKGDVVSSHSLFEWEDEEEAVKSIKKIPSILTAFTFDPYELKSANKFIF